MAYYSPPLINLDYLRADRQFDATETDDDGLLYSYIVEASADFQEGLQRIVAPYIATQKFSRADVRDGYDLRVADFDLLAVTSVTNGDGATVDSSNYNLRPDNSYPKMRIELVSAGANLWSFPYRESRASIAGVWGYVPHYGSHLSASGAVVPVGNMTDSVTSLVLASGGSAFSPLDLIVIGSEWMLVTAVSTNTLTVTRAQLGTTAAAHTSADVIYLYSAPADIRFAVRLLVGYYYKTKHQLGGRVQVYAGGVLQVADLDPRVEDIRKRHARVLMSMGV